MDCMDGLGFGAIDDDGSAGDASPPHSSARSPVETELQFLTRRAMEESRLAKEASTPQASAAHAYLASAYSAQVAKELAKEAELEALLLHIN